MQITLFRTQAGGKWLAREKVHKNSPVEAKGKVRGGRRLGAPNESDQSLNVFFFRNVFLVRGRPRFPMSDETGQGPKWQTVAPRRGRPCHLYLEGHGCTSDVPVRSRLKHTGTTPYQGPATRNHPTLIPSRRGAVQNQCSSSF